MFWFVCIMMTLATLALVLAPIVQPPGEVSENPEVALYKAQFAEVERDVARHILAEDDAARVKTEIARRLLAASETSTGQLVTSPISRSGAVVAAIGVSVLAGGIYWSIGTPGYPDLPLQTRIAAAEEARSNRPSQVAAEATARVLTPPEVPEEYLASVEQLRTLMPQRGDDLQGWELLAYHESRMRNFSGAAMAQSRVIEIKSDSATVDDLLRYVELLVAAADGYVSPEAEGVVRQVLELAPNSVPALYYLGAMFDQTDRPDLAFRLWRSILEGGAPESLYTGLVRDQIANAAFHAGVSYAAPAAVPSVAGPSADQMLAAQDMAEEDRTAMIEGMVSGLAQRLATEGGSVSEWARLISAYGVLGRLEDAKAVLTEGRDVFGGSQGALQLLNEAAVQAGLEH